MFIDKYIRKFEKNLELKKSPIICYGPMITVSQINTVLVRNMKGVDKWNITYL
jgi:hypothetical protein